MRPKRLAVWLRRVLLWRWFFGVLVLVAVGIFGLLTRLDVDLGLAVAVAVGIPSLGFAAIQFYVASDTIEKLVELESKLSTRRLDEAPYFMPEIVDLLERETGEILVFCDFPAYGAISNPSEYERYVEIVCKCRTQGAVRMLCLDESVREELAGAGYDEWPSLRAQFHAKKDFLAAIKDKNVKAEEVHFTGVEMHKTSLVMPLYFWAGKKEAIFSLRRYAGDRMVEIGFRTSDKPLIDALWGIFDRYLTVDGQYSMVKKAS
jgi:hypothetical protein